MAVLWVTAEPGTSYCMPDDLDGCRPVERLAKHCQEMPTRVGTFSTRSGPDFVSNDGKCEDHIFRIVDRRAQAPEQLGLNLQIVWDGNRYVWSVGIARLNPDEPRSLVACGRYEGFAIRDGSKPRWEVTLDSFANPWKVVRVPTEDPPN